MIIVTYENTLFTFGKKIMTYLFKDMCKCNIPKNSNVNNIGFDSKPSFIRCLVK